jgi:hypothetical protein
VESGRASQVYGELGPRCARASPGGTMYEGERSRRGRLRTLVVVLAITGLATVMMGGCSGDDPKTVISETTTASPSPSDAGLSATGEGLLVAQEILGTFDELAGKVVELSKDKPEPAVLGPQLEGLYESYMPKMTELNAKYLALRDSGMSQFRECNRHVSDNRPQLVSAMDNALAEAVKYYNFELGDQEMVSLLTKRPIELLDVAVNQD